MSHGVKRINVSPSLSSWMEISNKTYNLLNSLHFTNRVTYRIPLVIHLQSMIIKFSFMLTYVSPLVTHVKLIGCSAISFLILIEGVFKSNFLLWRQYLIISVPTIPFRDWRLQLQFLSIQKKRSNTDPKDLEIHRTIFKEYHIVFDLIRSSVFRI